MIDERIYREMEEYDSQGWTVVDGLVAPDFFAAELSECMLAATTRNDPPDPLKAHQ